MNTDLFADMVLLDAGDHAAARRVWDAYTDALEEDTSTHLDEYAAPFEAAIATMQQADAYRASFELFRAYYQTTDETEQAAILAEIERIEPVTIAQPTPYGVLMEIFEARQIVPIDEATLNKITELLADEWRTEDAAP